MRAALARHYRDAVLTRRILLPLAATALVLAGCGGGDGGGNSGGTKNAPVVKGARVIKVDARSFEFDPSTIDVKPGEDVTIELKSEDTFHDFEVRGQGHIVGANGSETAKGGLTIGKPGRYTFFCSVPGHEAAGMEGTIVVA
jgi:cytochrome c oxidase subunit 2